MVFYTLFEVFVLVFPPVYGFNLGEAALSSLSCVVGAGIIVVGHFWTMQSLSIYIMFPYPKYAASLSAGNSVSRSCTSRASVIFARPLFMNMGAHKDVTLLASLSMAVYLALF